jgi:hypothetical protein
MKNTEARKRKRAAAVACTDLLGHVLMLLESEGAGRAQ